MPRFRSTLSALVFVLMICWGMTTFPFEAQAQTIQQSSPVTPKTAVLGESCKRRTDDIAGVVKVDACGRWYCGRVDVNDITVLNPNFDKSMACRWQLVGSKCKCLRR